MEIVFYILSFIFILYLLKGFQVFLCQRDRNRKAIVKKWSPVLDLRSLVKTDRIIILTWGIEWFKKHAQERKARREELKKIWLIN